MTSGSFNFFDLHSGRISDWRKGLDPRHLLMFRAVLSLGPIRTAIEIGSGEGVSTAAIMDACATGDLDRAYLLDLAFPDAFGATTTQDGQTGKMELMRGDSIDSLLALADRGATASCALVDGSHVFFQVHDEFSMLQALGVHTVIVHDCRNWERDAHGRNIFYDGSHKLVELLGGSLEWTVNVDHARRPAELTDRGLAIATRHAGLKRPISSAFKRWSIASRGDVLRALGHVASDEPRDNRGSEH